MTVRSNYKTTERPEVPEIDAFLDEIEAVCRKHNMSISHEDGHGAFIIKRFDTFEMQWLRDAFDDTAA